MMTIMGKRFTNRGISTIIAALLLIAIAIAAGVLLYVFSIGLIGSLQGSGGQQTKDQVIMEAYSWPIGGTLTLNLRNTGSTSLDLTKVDFYVGGVAMATPTPTMNANNPTGCTQSAFGPGCGASDALTIANLTPSNGVAYVVKLGLNDGGVMSYSAVYGSSS
jgi:flagellin-like protein